jgi:hypothetical protein
MSLVTILRRGVGLQLEVMTEPSAEALVAFASDENAVMLDASLKAVYR